MRRLALAVLLTLFCSPLLAQAPAPSVRATAIQPSFKALDANHDGRVSLEEVLAYAKRDSSLVKPFRAADVDTNADGVLSVEELRAAGLKGLEQFGAVDLKELDTNGDGYITRAEIDAYFQRKHRAAFARADADHDGSLSRGEFVLYRF